MLNHPCIDIYINIYKYYYFSNLQHLFHFMTLHYLDIVRVQEKLAVALVYLWVAPPQRLYDCLRAKSTQI